MLSGHMQILRFVFGSFKEITLGQDPGPIILIEYDQRGGEILGFFRTAAYWVAAATIAYPIILLGKMSEE